MSGVGRNGHEVLWLSLAIAVAGCGAGQEGREVAAPAASALCEPSAWVYMGDNVSACEGHAGESCGWTTTDQGQGYHCQATSWGTGCEPGGPACSGGGSNPGKPPSGSCNAAAWVYMGDNVSACEGHAGESCGWTTTDQGQGYHCQATSWGTGCEPGGPACSGGGSNPGKPPSGRCNAAAWVYMGDNVNACEGHAGESCGWTTTDQGQGYHCQATSWGTGCEPGGPACSGGGSSGSPGGTGSPTGEFSRDPQAGMLTEAQGTQVALQVAGALMRDFGLSALQVAGVVGNLYHESAGMNANMNQVYAYEGSGGPGAPSSDLNQGYGWAQWTYGRKGLFLTYCSQQGLNPASPAANYAYLKHELETDQAATISALRAAVSPEDAARIFRRVFEVAEIPNDDGRIVQANRLFGLL